VKRTFLIVSLLLALVLVVSVALITTETGLRLVARVVLPMMPGQLSFETLEGRVIGPLRVTKLSWEHDDRRLTVERFDVEWEPTRLPSRHLHIERLDAKGVHWQAPESATRKAEAGVFSVPALPLTITTDVLHVDDILIEQGAVSVPVHSLRVAGRLDNERYSLETLVVESSAFDVSGTAMIGVRTPHDVNTELSWTVRIDGADTPVHGTTSANGNTDTLELRVAADGPFKLSLSGAAANLLGDAHIDGKLDIERPAVTGDELPTGALSATLNYSLARDAFAFDGRLLAPDLWATTAVIQANGNLNADIVDLRQIRLSVEDLATTIEANGTLRTDLSDLNLELEWTDLVWPPGEEPRFTSSHGVANLTGSKNQYNLTSNGTTELGALPAANFTLHGRGTTSQFEIIKISANFEQGQLTGRGLLDWTASPTARLELVSRDLELSRWHTQLEGRLGFDSVVVARLPPEGAQVSVDVHGLEGQLRGNALSGAASFDYAPGMIRFREVDVRAGPARIEANGQIGAVVDLRWNLHVPDIALLVSDGSGLVSSRGIAGGQRDSPGFNGELIMKDVKVGTFSAKRVGADFDVGLNADDTAHIDLEGSGVEIGSVSLGTFKSSTDGTVARHKIDVEIDAPAVKLKTTLQGGVTDGVWQGQITSFDPNLGDTGVWTLTDPASLTIGRDRIALAQTCLRQNDSQLCAGGELSITEPSRTEFQLDSLPVQMFAPLLPPDLTYEGDISGHGHLASSGSAWLGAAQLQLSDGRVLNREDDNENILIAYENGLLETTLNPDSIHAEIKLNLRDAGLIDADVTVPRGAAQTLAGTVQARIENLSIVTALVPQIASIDGRLQTNLALAGTKTSPDLSGQIGLQATELVLPDLGITLKDTVVDVVTKGNDLRFDGRAGSGDGHISLAGDLRWQEGGPRGQLKIDGESFRAIDLPEIWLDASPALTLTVDGRDLSIGGDITVPAARITPIDIGTGITVSPDQVIVGQTADSAPVTPWQINGTVQVTAGEAVHIKGYGLEGDLSGSVLVIETPNKPTVGRGALEIINGRYRAYGQELTIDTGRLDFTGGRIDDPGLNLRATRTAGEVIAGAQVRGALRAPVLTLYSVPAMSDTQAMSYLITGRSLEDLNEADQTAVSDTATRLALQGSSVLASSLGRELGLDSVEFQDAGETASTSLVVGKHLSPRLFVSYGVGLFEAINTLRLRYRINSNLTLETQSGALTSTDLLYSIER